MSNTTILPFEATHPGTLIQDELEVRNELSQKELAVLLGVKPSFLNEIIKGKRPLTADLAVLLENALGISADYWLRFQLQYELDAAKIKEKNIQKIKLIEEWNLLSRFVPTKYFSKNGLLEDDLAENISKILEIYEVACIDDLVNKFSEFGEITDLDSDILNQLAWLLHARYMAGQKQVGKYESKKLPQLMVDLRNLVNYIPNNLEGSLDALLSSYGIKLVFMDSSLKATTSVSSFWSPPNPCIVLSLKSIKMENIALPLMRELAFIILGMSPQECFEWKDIMRIKNEELAATVSEMVEEVLRPNFNVADFWEKYRLRGD